MNGLVKRVGATVLGMVVTLAWWSLRDGGSDVTEGIPTAVWDGGGGTLTVEVHTTTAAKFLVSFSERQEDGRMMETWENVPAGSHSWTIDVPRDVGGYIEMGAVEPKVGDKLSWRIKLNGEIVDEQFDELEEPLESGYAFFLQSYYEEYATAELAED